MHPPLATHKHPDCDNIIEIFEQCHDDHPLMKFMGTCNDLKRQLTLCLRAERKMTQKANAEKAAVKREKIQQKWKEIDENS